jgi:Na+-driven multidrug efflux pump
LILVPLWGGLGAATGSSLGYSVSAVVAVILYRRLIAPSRAELFSVRRDDVSWVRGQVRGGLSNILGRIGGLLRRYKAR